MSDIQTATGWRPNEGDELVGVVISLDKGWSDYKNAFYPIVTLKSGDGTVTNVHCFHAVLERRMLSLAPAIGDKLRITMQGKTRTKDGKREVTNYTVESNRKQDSGAFWNGLGGGSQSPATASRTVPVEADDFTQQELAAESEEIPF